MLLKVGCEEKKFEIYLTYSHHDAHRRDMRLIRVGTTLIGCSSYRRFLTYTGPTYRTVKYSRMDSIPVTTFRLTRR